MIQVLREYARRRPVYEVTARDLIDEMAAKLRSFFYPKQRAFFSSTAKQRATRKTRRAGATTGGCRELLARAIEREGFRATYCGTTREECIARAWRSDTKGGLVDILDEFGTRKEHRSLLCFDLGGVEVVVREVDLRLVFSNGSEIELFAAKDDRTRRKKRGGAKHVFWIDEAQDFFELGPFLDSVVGASMGDFDGEVWLTGTPGKDCVGRFYDVTKDPDDGDVLEGWEVHSLAQVDNPFFGRVEKRDAAWVVIDNIGTEYGPFSTENEAEEKAIAVRFDRTVARAMRESGRPIDDPDLQREYFARWVRSDARYVYPVHVRSNIYYAPSRIAANPISDAHPPWYDHAAALEDLPKRLDGSDHEWFFALGADFGYSPDPFALVAWAFCYELPGIYEVMSWKATMINTDDQGRYMQLLWNACKRVVSFVGDPAGKQDDFEVWRTRLGLPIEEANKRGKNTLEAFLADDIARGVVYLREGSPLAIEMRHLVYLPTKPGMPRIVHKFRLVGGVRHGDHCCDAARYSYEDLRHFVSQLRPPEKSEEEQIEEEIDADDERSYGEYEWLR